MRKKRMVWLVAAVLVLSAVVGWVALEDRWRGDWHESAPPDVERAPAGLTPAAPDGVSPWRGRGRPFPPPAADDLERRPKMKAE